MASVPFRQRDKASRRSRALHRGAAIYPGGWARRDADVGLHFCAWPGRERKRECELAFRWLVVTSEDATGISNAVEKALADTELAVQHAT